MLDTEKNITYLRSTHTTAMNVRSTHTVGMFAILLGLALPSAASWTEASPQGWNPNAGWAPARLNDAISSPLTVSYAFPENAAKVRLFIVDTAVANPNNWFDGNKKLSIVHQETIGFQSGPLNTTHGTRVLSVIAGPEAGLATGVPIEVVVLNIFPSSLGGVTDFFLMEDAFDEIYWYQRANPGPPAVVCAAIGSNSPVVDWDVKFAMERLVDQGMVVVTGAGNQAANAANYTPSAFGTKNGLICAGASDINNNRVSWTNFGSVIDIYAPGENVRAYDPTNPQIGQNYLMSGTSAATAMVAAAAVIERSLNPTLSPAQVEANIKARAFPAPVGPLLQIPIPEDIDYDGVPNEIESFLMSDPTDRTKRPIPLKLRREGTTSVLTFEAWDGLLHPTTPFTLIGGGYWRILREGSGAIWSDAGGTVETTPLGGGKVEVNVRITDTASIASYRLEVVFED